MERAIGKTFKVGDNELIVKEVEGNECVDENGQKCYFFSACLTSTKDLKKAGECVKYFREDKKNVIFIKI